MEIDKGQGHEYAGAEDMQDITKPSVHTCCEPAKMPACYADDKTQQARHTQKSSLLTC